jgi:putative transposase
MPRVGRIYQRALCYHVMNRGVNRSIIFVDDADRRYFSRLVLEYKEACGVKVYHWAWMGNHFHMLIEVVYENLRGFVGGIQQAYVQYHHARHNGSGVFWQGRFKSKPVQVGPYLVSCGRYIERNPVRKGLTPTAWLYPWSSAAAYVRQAVDEITDENPYVGAFTQADRQAYADALMSGVDEQIVRSMEGERAIGSREFSATLKMERGRYRVKRGRPAKNAPINTKAVET